MNKTERPSIQLEILISTMNRNSLDFLKVMFHNNEIADYQILVINQTTEHCIIDSDEPNIRVINSFEKGLSKSRNLAIDNAIGEVCLFADDDVVYLKNFEIPIMEAYKDLRDADVITFKTLTTENVPFYKYPNKIGVLGDFSKNVLSIEISFKRSSIADSKVRFNEHFGLGATFKDSENYVFFKDIFKLTNLKLYFVPEFIVIHKSITSSNEVDSDRLIFARSALNYRLYGNSAYVYVTKYVLYLMRHRLIQFNQIIPKFRVGHSGIQTYKKLNDH